MKKVFALCCVLCLLALICTPILVAAEDNVTVDGVIYRETRDGWSVVGYTDALPTVLNIPSSIESRPVVAIQQGAFSNCAALTAVTIPDSVTTIGANAFEGCVNLKSAVVSKSVDTLELRTFARCTALTSITIPVGVTTVGIATFDGCSNLTSITLPESVTTIGSGAFVGCKKLLSISLPDSITTIGESVFSDVPALYDTTYRYDGVVYFGNHAILHIDPDYEEVRIREGTKTIASYAFHRSTRLRSLLIPESVTHVNSYAFLQCGNFGVYYAGNQTDKDLMTIDDIDDGNSALHKATWHYDTTKLPTSSTTTATTTAKPTATTTTVDSTVTTATITTTQTEPTTSTTAATLEDVAANEETDEEHGNPGIVVGFAVSIAIGVILAVLAAAAVITAIIFLIRKKAR